jgi:O-antigen biosynthesis protein
MSRKHKQIPKQVKVQESKSIVDVIIPVFRRFDLLWKCLIALPEAMGDIPYKLYMVDNGSPKEEADAFYKQFQYPITIIRNKENLGFPRACNLAAKRGSSPFLFFLNSDVILEPNSVSKLVAEFDDPKVGVCGMKLVFPPETASVNLNQDIRPPNKIQHVGIMTNIRGDFYHIFVGWDADHPKPNAMRTPDAVTGAALMVRRNLFTKAGYFNEIYGTGCFEDCELCMMAKELGYNVIVNTSACGIHYVAATAEFYKIPYALGYNRMTFLQRWGNKMQYREHETW